MQIPLSKGQFALIDEADSAVVTARSWHVVGRSQGSTKPLYAGTTVGRHGLILMHRLLVQPPEGLHVDHINGNGLDNRRANLRICDLFQNAWNAKANPRNTTGVRNVSILQCRGYTYFVAAIVCRKKLYKKAFQTLAEAAAWAEETRSALHGEFAYREDRAA